MLLQEVVQRRKKSIKSITTVLKAESCSLSEFALLFFFFFFIVGQIRSKKCKNRYSKITYDKNAMHTELVEYISHLIINICIINHNDIFWS